MRPDRSLLEEQIAYYRARAPEYDEWFNREGRRRSVVFEFDTVFFAF